MLDIKAWLEATGEPVADTAFVDAVPMPYIVFLDSAKHGGADLQNVLIRHSLTVERYAATDEDNEKLEVLFDAKAFEYKKDRMWLDDIKCFMTTYDFDFIEKN